MNEQTLLQRRNNTSTTVHRTLIYGAELHQQQRTLAHDNSPNQNTLLPMHNPHCPFTLICDTTN